MSSFIISSFSATSGAIADGDNTNDFTLTVTNGDSYASGVNVKIELSGDAIFVANGKNSIELQTNSLGNVSSKFSDVTSETVTITATLTEYSDVKQQTTSNFSQYSPQTNKIQMLLTIDNAIADGEDQNIVAIQSLNGNVVVPAVKISVALTNGAVFINGSNTADITTDSNGLATLPFTNNTAGTTRITAYLTENISIYSQLNAIFVSASPELVTELDVISDNARANGQSTNQVKVTVHDKVTNKVQAGVSVSFSVSGSAKFFNGKQSCVIVTDGHGEAYASLVDNVTEDITVTTVVNDITSTVVVHFSNNYQKFGIARAYNNNKTFSTDMPTTAWIGAKFFIEISGGSGDYSWSINNPGVDIAKVDPNTLSITFSSEVDLSESFIIQFKDNITEEEDNYSFFIKVFFTHYGEWRGFDNHDVYPSVGELSQLFKEWGDMSVYDGWVSREHNVYWTRDYNYWVCKTVNLRNGSVNGVIYTYLALGHSHAITSN